MWYPHLSVVRNISFAVYGIGVLLHVIFLVCMHRVVELSQRLRLLKFVEGRQSSLMSSLIFTRRHVMLFRKVSCTSSVTHLSSLVVHELNIVDRDTLLSGPRCLDLSSLSFYLVHRVLLR